MYKNNTIGVVVVAYNEEGFVGDVIETLPEFVDRAYVVDDGSTDGTWEEIRLHADEANARRTDAERGRDVEAQLPDAIGGDGGFEEFVVPLRHEENKGVGAAVKTGYRHAYRDGLDVTVTMAGDGQMDPTLCHRIVDPVATGQADYAKGNRLRDSELRKDMPRWRLFGNWLLTLLTKIASGYWKMLDPSNGYTAISHDALGELDIDAIYENYGSLHDVLVRLNANNLRIADVSIPAVYNEESSGIVYSTFIPKLSTVLLRDFIWRLRVKYVVRDFHPLVLFYAFGVIGGLVGVIETIRTFVGDEESACRGMLSVVLFLISGALLAFAMTFDMLENQDLEYRPEQCPPGSGERSETG